ncbi:MAG TPA: tagaturonate reductase [Chitinophagaceae bacterium]|nr:tagaturonate reductase [Chitinophagaceae bacterium]
MQLSKETIRYIQPSAGLIIPPEGVFDLPERVIQFGTGVLLRGLPDYFIDKANRQGIFNGRIVVIKSTAAGDTDSFKRQDGLYTLCVRGIDNNNKTDETIINSSISRVLAAAEDWSTILLCAHNPTIQLIISNTTEIGIVLTDDNILDSPPSSFPGKLLALLYERYKVFNGSTESGMVIVPTELISDNGSMLKSIVFSLAEKNNLEKDFIHWLDTSNHFCNSLVDRIVPGKLPLSEHKRLEEKLGYQDELVVMAESFRFWAIESAHEKVNRVLSFSRTDEGIIVTPAIEKFRELKLRLLNGTHTFSSGLAFLAGFDTVRETMSDEDMSAFIRRLMMLEIASAMDGDTVSYNEACAFANSVMDRFRNPFMEHRWLSITVNFTSKMRLRNIPLLVRHYAKNKKAPEHMAMGFAGFLLFMKCTLSPDGDYYGKSGNKKYLVQDEHAARFAELWAKDDIEYLVNSILSDAELWETDLTALEGFPKAVMEKLQLLEKEGVLSGIGKMELQKTIA